MIGDRLGQGNEVVVRQADAVVRVVRIRMRQGPQLVERDIARSIDADGERQGARRIADVTFDDACVDDQDNRLASRDVDQPGRAGVDAERVGNRVCRSRTVGTERVGEHARERLRVVGRKDRLVDRQ